MVENEASEGIRAERRENYRLVLEQILGDPSRLMQLAQMSKLTLRQTYVLVDNEIRELKKEEKQ